MTSLGTERRKPVLLIQHAHYEHPAALKRALEAQGIVTQWIHPYRGDPYPALSEIRGIISLGGPMGANDESEHPWITTELELLQRAVETGKPTVGICLGGQMMARALGGKVERHETVELGWFPLQLNAAGNADPILGAIGASPMVYQWHQDTFFLPPGAELLASSEACARQAYRISDHAWGFQFHPEADHQLVHEWLAVEGIEDEILDAQQKHGKKSVQDAGTQRARALQCERSSLRIASSISQIFSSRPYTPEPEDVRAQYHRWIQQRTLLSVEFEGSDRRLHTIKGTPSAVIEIQAGEFMLFREENSILWPIRLDCVRRVHLS